MPKSSAVGDTIAEVTGDVPLPLAISDTTGVEAASLVNVTTPVTDPEVCGENESVTTCVAPGARTRGNAGPKIVKPLPLTVPANTVVLAVPGFDIVIDEV